MTKSKITLFTGAGANFGAGSVVPQNPPLGYQLYAELERFAPDMMSQISAIVGDEHKEGFEMKMHEIMESGKVLHQQRIKNQLQRFLNYHSH